MSYEDDDDNLCEDMVPSPDYRPAQPMLSCVGRGAEAFLWVGDNDGETCFAVLNPEELRALLRRLIPRVLPGHYIARRKTRAKRKP